MSNDESDPEPPRRKVRRLEDSPISTASGSPIIGSSFRGRIENRGRNPISNDSSESGSPIISTNFRRRLPVGIFIFLYKTITFICFE